MRIVRDLYYADNGDSSRSLNLYLPDTAAFPLMIYIHGGGMVSGDKSNEGDVMAPYLCDNGVALASINYRMYPEAKYPDFIEDSAAAVAYLLNEIANFGKCTDVFVGGSSAGGYISMMLCFDEKYLGKHGIKPADISGFIHDAGQAGVHYQVLSERGLDPKRVVVDEAAPLYHVGTAEKYPPMLIIYSDSDIPNRPEELRLLISALRGFGHTEVEELVCHGTHNHYIVQSNEGSFEPDGYFHFSKMIYPFIKKHSKS